jgi:hypothetical protein
MHEKIYISLGILITWFAIFFIVPLVGFDINLWMLILSASIGGLFAGLLVLLGETVIENIILVLVFLVLAGVLWGHKPSLGFIFISVLISSVIGVITNQVNQYAANKALKLGTPKSGAP